MSTKKTQGKKLQGGGQLLEKLQNFNPPADNKNTIPVTEKLPIVSSNLISNYAPRENDPFSRFSLDKMKDNPDYTPGMNDRRGDPIQVGMEQYTPTYSLEEVDFEYTPPLIPITPDEMITPPVWAPDTIILNNDHRIWAAKQKALELIDGYKPPKYRDDLKLPGAGGRTAIATVVKGLKAQGKISAHDELIANKLSEVSKN